MAATKNATEKKIRLIALLGSVRPGNNTGKALAVAKRAADKQPHVEFEIIDPANLNVPLPGKGSTDDTRWLQHEVKHADAVLLATPEYHGSYSSVMKLLIDNMGFPSALKGKPVALLGVASGSIGAIKALEHLRSVASHVGAMVLPGPVSVNTVKSKFDQSGALLDEHTGTRIEQLVDNLIAYTIRHTCPERSLEDFVRDQ